LIANIYIGLYVIVVDSNEREREREREHPIVEFKKDMNWSLKVLFHFLTLVGWRG
jgi:hypothetical protein